MLKSKLRALIPAGVVTTVLVASFIVFPAAGTLASCGSGTFAASPTSPQPAGTIVTLSATAACGGYGGGGGYGYGANIPNFRFWELDPGSRWSMVQDYTTQSSFSWNTRGLAAGVYNWEVDIKSNDEPNSIGYDFVKSLTYTLSAPVPCTAAGLTVSGGTDATHGATGGTFVMHGTSASCANPVYRFWIRDPGRTWSIVQDYSTVATHTWGPVGTYFLGQYSMEVDVRDASESTVYDTVSNLTFTLVGCTVAGLTATPNGGVHGAVPVTLTATSTCPGTAQYRFWVQDPGSTWSMVQNYGASNTYTWAAANQRMGVTRMEVDVRDLGSQEVYEIVSVGVTDTLS